MYATIGAACTTTPRSTSTAATKCGASIRIVNRGADRSNVSKAARSCSRVIEGCSSLSAPGNSGELRGKAAALLLNIRAIAISLLVLAHLSRWVAVLVFQFAHHALMPWHAVHEVRAVKAEPPDVVGSARVGDVADPRVVVLVPSARGGIGDPAMAAQLRIERRVGLPIERMREIDADVTAPRTHVVAHHQAIELRQLVYPLDLVRLGLPGTVRPCALIYGGIGPLANGIFEFFHSSLSGMFPSQASDGGSGVTGRPFRRCAAWTCRKQLSHMGSRWPLTTVEGT